MSSCAYISWELAKEQKGIVAQLCRYIGLHRVMGTTLKSFRANFSIF